MAAATSTSTGLAGMPNRTTRPPFRAMRNASPIACGEPDGAAAEHGHRAAGKLLLARGEDGVPERLLERRDLGWQLRAVRLPDHALGHGDVARERAVPVDAENLRPLAHVSVPGATVKAHAARDVALGRDEVADSDVTDVRADLDDRAGELVTERDGRLDPSRGPAVPEMDVEVGAAHACGLDLDHDIRRPRF